MPDSKLSSMTEQTTPALDDITYLTNTGGTIDRKVKIETVRFVVKSQCRAYKDTTDQSITTATHTALTLNAEDFDDQSYHDNATNNSRFTIPTTGRYRIDAQITYALNGTGDRGVVIWKNSIATGTRVAHTFNKASSTVNHRAHLSTGVVALTAGDYIELGAYQDSGGNLDVKALTTNGARETWMSIERVG